MPVSCQVPQPSVELLNKTYHSSQMQWVRDVERHYAFPSLQTATYLYAHQASFFLAASLTSRIIALILYVAGTALVYLLYYQPLLWILNDETRRICSMLLMLPGDVLGKLPRIKTFINQLSSSLAHSEEED